MSGRVFAPLSEGDLAELGVSLFGHRRVLSIAIRELRRRGNGRSPRRIFPWVPSKRARREVDGSGGGGGGSAEDFRGVRSDGPRVAEAGGGSSREGGGRIDLGLFSADVGRAARDGADGGGCAGAESGSDADLREGVRRRDSSGDMEVEMGDRDSAGAGSREETFGTCGSSRRAAEGDLPDAGAGRWVWISGSRKPGEREDATRLAARASVKDFARAAQWRAQRVETKCRDSGVVAYAHCGGHANCPYRLKCVITPRPGGVTSVDFLEWGGAPHGAEPYRRFPKAREGGLGAKEIAIIREFRNLRPA